MWAGMVPVLLNTVHPDTCVSHIWGPGWERKEKVLALRLGKQNCPKWTLALFSRVLCPFPLLSHVPYAPNALPNHVSYSLPLSFLLSPVLFLLPACPSQRYRSFASHSCLLDAPTVPYAALGAGRCAQVSPVIWSLRGHRSRWLISTVPDSAEPSPQGCGLENCRLDLILVPVTGALWSWWC